MIEASKINNEIFMKTEFDIAKKLPPYVFEAIYQLKMQAKASGLEIIDFGMGNPDSSPPQFVMDEISNFSQNSKLYGYSVVGGVDVLKKALRAYYLRRFGVELSADEAIVTMGAKEGLTSLASAISQSDNYFVVQNPSYPIHTFAFVIARSNVVHINAIKPADFLVQFKNHVENAQKKPVAVIVNYPCNPTSQTVSLDFYEELVAFCKKHEIYIISDVAYAEIYYDEASKPCSILEVSGAKDVAIEFSSVSKSYSLAGARIGFGVGNKTLVAKLHQIKSYLDYGSFEPVQMACAVALSEKSDDYLLNLRKKYKSRAEFLVKLLNEELGWNVEMPKASMFLWTKIPPKFAHLTSFEFCKKLLLENGVVLSPGNGFGDNGEGFVRFSLIHDEEKMIDAVSRLKEVF